LPRGAVEEQLGAANACSGAATPERGILRTPERSPRFVPTPDWGVGADT